MKGPCQAMPTSCRETGTSPTATTKADPRRSRSGGFPCKTCPLAALCLPVGINNLMFQQCEQCGGVFVRLARLLIPGIVCFSPSVQIKKLPDCSGPPVIMIQSCGSTACNTMLWDKQACLQGKRAFTLYSFEQTNFVGVSLNEKPVL